MDYRKTNILLAVITVISSVGIYMLQILIFRDPDNTLFYLLQDLAFVPIQVALVTLFFNRLLNSREKSQKIKRNNVMITTFFVEAGSEMIGILSSFNSNFEEIRSNMTTHDLSGKALPVTRAKFKRFDVLMDSRASDLAALKAFFAERRPFLLSLLDSTALLEHDSFTDLLWAAFHMADELQSRDDLGSLPKSDLDHLSVDLLRAYRLLILEWMDYINYLNREYPYLYSLAVRKNPFSEVRDVIIHETT